MVDFHCWLDWLRNTWGIDEAHHWVCLWGCFQRGKTYSECSWCHSVSWGLQLNEKGTGGSWLSASFTLWGQVHVSSLLSPGFHPSVASVRCFITGARKGTVRLMHEKELKSIAVCLVYRLVRRTEPIDVVLCISSFMGWLEFYREIPLDWAVCGKTN